MYIPYLDTQYDDMTYYRCATLDDIQQWYDTKIRNKYKPILTLIFLLNITFIK